MERGDRRATLFFLPASRIIMALEATAGSSYGDLTLSRAATRRHYFARRLRALTAVAITLGASVWLCGCSQGAPSTPHASGGSSGLEINLPPSTAMDCDAQAPIENHAPLQSSDPLCDPSAAPASFSKDVAPIVGSCSGEICHVPWTYDAFVGVHSTACCDKRFLVNPYEPSNSALVQALLGTNPCVGGMPPGNPFARTQIEPVIAWVCQGAMKN